MSTRSDRTVAHLVVAGALLAGLGLLHEISASPEPPAPAVASSSPAARAPVPRMPASVGPVRQDPRAADPVRSQNMPAKPRSHGTVRRAEALPADPVTSNPDPVTSNPDRIVVPDLGVDAPVVPITADDGVLVPPGDPGQIGWWSAGARPGASTGTAVLTGHTVSSGGGAFDDLDLMVPGQRVRIDSGAASTDYVVRSVTVYLKQSLAEHAAAIFDQSVPGRVALVTCEDWNGSVYLSNAVVIAEPTG